MVTSVTNARRMTKHTTTMVTKATKTAARTTATATASTASSASLTGSRRMFLRSVLTIALSIKGEGFTGFERLERDTGNAVGVVAEDRFIGSHVELGTHFFLCPSNKKRGS